MPEKKIENAINEFYLATHEYCKLLENISVVSKRVFLSNAQKLLNLVYLKASLIEKPDDIEDGEAEKFVQEADWKFISEQLSTKLALSDKFIEISLPQNVDPENYEAITLSECFADIYQDLRDFSSSFELGNSGAIRASLFECIENFEKFWGLRALAVMTSIHNLLYGDEIADDEIVDDESNNSDSNQIDTSNWLINKRFNN